EALARPGWLAADAMVVLERDQRSDAPQWPAGWEPLGARRYGETTIHSARIPCSSAARPPPLSRPPARLPCAARNGGYRPARSKRTQSSARPLGRGRRL